MVIDYSKSKIYMIKNRDTNDIYVGSTARKYISTRMTEHRSHYKGWKYKNNVTYCTSFILFIYGNPYIELIENYSCKDINELKKRERYWIEKINCVNKQYPSRNPNEYNKSEKGKEIRRKAVSKYRNKDKKAFNEYRKEYRKNYYIRTGIKI